MPSPPISTLIPSMTFLSHKNEVKMAWANYYDCNTNKPKSMSIALLVCTELLMKMRRVLDSSFLFL